MTDLLFLLLSVPATLLQAAPAQATSSVPAGSWWLWLALLLLCSLAVAWLLQRETVSPALGQTGAAPSEPVTAPDDAAHNRQAATPPPAVAVFSAEKSGPAETAVEAQPAGERVTDDLTAIEGIGPKIKGILQEADVRTFADLARADVAELKQILVNAGLRVNNPATWPAQAALAADGRWEELKAMQSQLKAGRRG